MTGLGIYVQIPFCASKCSFCNFSSRVSPESVFADYCGAVVAEVRNLPEILRASGIRDDLLSAPVDTIYLGGGTPPIVGMERLGSIIAEIRKCVRAESLAEFTVEVTPGSVDERALWELLDMGVNRLSVGAQTFDDQELRSVGRLHTSRDTLVLVADARRAGFKNISLDLIAGLPFQTPATWQQSLDAVAALRPEHISVYVFEIDEKSRLGGEVLRHGTRFHSESVPTEEFMADAYEIARRFLRASGYRQYEISNFALPAYGSIHNRKYWDLESYVGLGAGAHSFDGERRWSNWISTAEYQARLARGESPVAESHCLTTDEQIEEFFFLGLRRAEGVDLSVARQVWGAPRIRRWEPAITGLINRGLIEKDADRIRVAEGAYLVSNEVFQEFLAASEEAQ